MQEMHEPTTNTLEKGKKGLKRTEFGCLLAAVALRDIVSHGFINGRDWLVQPCICLCAVGRCQGRADMVCLSVDCCALMTTYRQYE